MTAEREAALNLRRAHLETEESRLKLKEAETRTTLAPLQETLIRIVRELADVQARLDSIHLEVYPEDWPFLLSLDSGGSAIRYQAAEMALEKMGLRGAGRYLEGTGQMLVEIALDRGDEAQSALALHGVRTLLPYINPSPEHHGKVFAIKVFAILDSYLGERDTPYLVVDEGMTARIEQRYSSDQWFPTLDAAFEYIRKFLYYQDKGRNG